MCSPESVLAFIHEVVPLASCLWPWNSAVRVANVGTQHCTQHCKSASATSDVPEKQQLAREVLELWKGRRVQLSMFSRGADP